jgi:hypothetical protein
MLNVFVDYQAEFWDVTRKPLLLGVGRRVCIATTAFVPCAVIVGTSLHYIALDLRWWHTMTILVGFGYIWFISWTFILTCYCLTTAAKNIGDEMVQVRTFYTIGINNL